MINDVIFTANEIDIIISSLSNNYNVELREKLREKLKPILNEAKRIERIEYLKKEIIKFKEEISKLEKLEVKRDQKIDELLK